MSDSGSHISLMVKCLQFPVGLKATTCPFVVQKGTFYKAKGQELKSERARLTRQSKSVFKPFGST